MLRSSVHRSFCMCCYCCGDTGVTLRAAHDIDRRRTSHNLVLRRPDESSTSTSVLQNHHRIMANCDTGKNLTKKRVQHDEHWVPSLVPVLEIDCVRGHYLLRIISCRAAHPRKHFHPLHAAELLTFYQHQQMSKVPQVFFEIF